VAVEASPLLSALGGDFFAAVALGAAAFGVVALGALGAAGLVSLAGAADFFLAMGVRSPVYN
jgi:hypothetical protein